MLCLFGICAIKLIKQQKNSTLYNFDNQTVLPLRGILALLIVFHHISGVIKDLDIPSKLDFKQFIVWGALVVGVFFFITGYGLTVSVMKKGKEYFNNFFRKRIVKLLIPAIIATIFFQLGEVFFNRFSISEIISDLNYGGLPLPKSWYVAAIIYFYTMFYVCFKFFKIKTAIILMWLASALYVFIIKMLNFGQYWWISTFAINIGICFAYFEHKIKNFINNNPQKGLFITFVIFLLTTTYALINSQTKINLPLGDIPTFWITPAILTVIIYFLGTPKSKILDFLGKISYEIYIVHGIFIHWIINYNNYSDRWILLIILVYVLSIISAYFLNKICKQINQKLIKN